MQRLSEAENVALGSVASFIQAVILQPTLYWKNASQQGLPFTMKPGVIYRGMSASLYSEVGSCGVQFFLTGALKHAIVGNTPRPLTDNETMLAALLGGSIAALYTSPLELIMIQQQRFGLSFPGTVKHIVQEHGMFNGVYRGLVSSVLRDGVYVWGLLGITPILQKHWESEYSLNKTAAGFGASLVGGASCAVLSCPTDVIKTCMQGDLERKKYGSLTSTIRTISKQGMGTFFNGVGWRIANITGTVLIVNECCQRLGPLMFPEAFTEDLYD